MQQSRFITLAMTALALASCGRQAKFTPPPRATDGFDPPAQKSHIAVPVEARLALFRTSLESAVPRLLWTIDERGKTCVTSSKVKLLVVKVKTPKLKCDLQGQVTRGALSLSGRGSDFIVTMPIHAVVHARNVAGMLKETASADAQVRAVVRLDLARDWNPRAKVRIEYGWTTEPGIDFLGQRIRFTDKANEKLAPVIKDVERTVEREVAKLNLRGEVANAWAQAFTSLQLNRENPPVWMRITPDKLHYGGYRVEGDAARGGKLRLDLGMTATTETFVGPRPADPAPKPLPAPSPLDRRAGKLVFFIPVIADYRELEPVIAKALVKRSVRPFDIPGVGPVRAQFGKVTAYGTGHGKIAVGVQFSASDVANRLGTSRGTVWLTGTPTNAPNSRKVRFVDLSVDGATDGVGTELLLKLASLPEVNGVIADALAQDFAKDYDKLIGKIDRAIEQKREGALLIRAQIDEVETGTLIAAGQGLYLPVKASGTAAITLVERPH
ncbi:DUF4403 family protein [Novosphingobium olei]|uniref:DUF4403 family protein n=1 Tax=Novosphingobium olei TaxID=2728851 RepID=A0A7Y0BMK8_9SPHN|nr:DUF4403 family protein [Novosphingobium olei]NML93135.1 DUF4403 family protein [Novosphingobium olei]